MVKSDGFDAYVTKGNSGLGLVVIHEVYGFNDYIKSVADTLSASGHTAAAVDLYHGKMAKSYEEAAKIREGLTRDQTLAGISAGLKALKGAGASKLGTLGFCMGGGFALLAACNNAEVTFCVDYYGSIENADETVNLRGPVLLFLGSEDTRITPWAYSTFLPAVVKYKKKVEVHVYPEAKHAFHNRFNPMTYHEPSAKDAWARTVDFLSRVK